MQGSTIDNVATPTKDGEVASKLYVDQQVGGSTLRGDKTFDSNVVIEGSLTVSGTTTTVNSETISLADNID